MRYQVLKERLRKHLLWLVDHQVSEEQLQRMINILCSNGDYEKELTQLLEAAANHNRTQSSWTLRSAVGRWIPFGLGTSQSTSSNVNKAGSGYMGLKPPRIDDAAFLAELCVLRDERPAYANIAKEIIQEATESLGAKLKNVSKDIARHAEREVDRYLQDISSSFRERRVHAEEISILELKNLIRRALDEEPGHPTNLYVLCLLASTNIALIPCRTRVVIRKVTVDNSGYESEWTRPLPIVAYEA